MYLRIEILPKLKLHTTTFWPPMFTYSESHINVAKGAGYIFHWKDLSLQTRATPSPQLAIFIEI